MIVHRTKHLTYGIAFIALLALVVALTVALYKGSFKSTDGLTLNAQRAGLTMDSGAPVKLRGVQIGRVTRVASAGDGASIGLEIDSKYLKLIPSNVTAQIVPPTAFGAKYVQLSAPTGAVTDPIRSGATIGADHLTVEVNSTFEHLMDVLHAVNPLELNNALSSLADGLAGRGTELGQLISQIDVYLNGLNPSLPNLSADLPKLASVLNTYQGVAPDLLRTAGNATVTSNTVVARQASLDALFLSLTHFSASTSKFLNTNGKPLSTLLDYLDPVTQTAARYAPVLPCTLSGLVVTGNLAIPAIGGQGPGIYTYTRLQPSDDPYTNPKNLPKLGEDSGPNCDGLPNVSQAESTQTFPKYDTGANPSEPAGTPGSTSGNPLATTLFGTLAGILSTVGRK